jgi:endoglucanase
VSGQGHANANALTISGNYTTALLSTWSYLFAVTTGHSYQISGWAKGTTLDPSARCQFTLGFYKPTAGSKVTVRDRSLLNDGLAKRGAFGEQNGVPMAVTEFGLTRACFEQNLGGINWLNDMVSVLNGTQENYIFFTYHNNSMGIFGDETQIPNPSHEITAITDFFRSELAGGDAQ